MDVKTGCFEILINADAASTLTVMIRKLVAGVTLIFVSFSFAPAASKPNLVLITLCSTRADRMGFLGAKGAFPPNLDRLPPETTFFEHPSPQAPRTVFSPPPILSQSSPHRPHT